MRKAQCDDGVAVHHDRKQYQYRYRTTSKTATGLRCEQGVEREAPVEREEKLSTKRRRRKVCSLVFKGWREASCTYTVDFQVR